MYDILIQNGTIVDGSGKDAYSADIAISGQRIVRIGHLDGVEAARVIDAKGKFVAPGFIDMHSHADTVILGYPKMESMLHQGITTFVGCQCGHSIAPVGKYWESSQALYGILCKISDKLYPDMYDRDYYALTEAAIPHIEAELGFSPTWNTMASFLDEVDRRGISGNIITLAGYNTLRMNIANPDEPVPLTQTHKNSLKRQINEAMEAGAFGMSTGLDYKPGVFTDTAELVEMAAELKPYEGIYFSHWRKTGQRAGTPKRQKKIDGIIEVLEIGKQDDIQVQISHISTGFDIFPSNDAFMQLSGAQRTLQIVDEYVRQGVRANFDVIPNITGGTIIAPDLVALFRPWYMLTNGIDLFVHNLKHPDYRKQLTDTILAGKFYRLNPVLNPDWDEGMQVIASRVGGLEGKTIKQIAQEHHRSSLDMIFDLIIIDPQIKVFAASYAMTMETVRTFLSHPLSSVGNDTFVFDLESTIHYDPQFPDKKPNPNTYCGFIKFLTELGMPRFEDSVRKLSGKPAEILGLTDRGLVKEGYRADLVVIDRANLRTNENLIEPRVYPDGIAYVLVNGTPVIDQGVHTGKLPGGVIRRQNR